MRRKDFEALPVGAEVRLTRTCQAYGQLYPTMDHLAYIEPGAVGTLVSGACPFVRGLGSFRCVDLPPETPLVDARGKPVVYENKHRNLYRVAVIETSIEPHDVRSLEKRNG